jgi:hypothetical protein
LVALNEGPEILIDKPMILVGRHPMCDTQLNSIRVSRRHCCMTLVGGELEVKDLGSTNGIQINGHRVVAGRLRPGDELAIAHIRYKLVIGEGQETTLTDRVGLKLYEGGDRGHRDDVLDPAPVALDRPPRGGRERRSPVRWRPLAARSRTPPPTAHGVCSPLNLHGYGQVAAALVCPWSVGSSRPPENRAAGRKSV